MLHRHYLITLTLFAAAFCTSMAKAQKAPGGSGGGAVVIDHDKNTVELYDLWEPRILDSSYPSLKIQRRKNDGTPISYEEAKNLIKTRLDEIDPRYFPMMEKLYRSFKIREISPNLKISPVDGAFPDVEPRSGGWGQLGKAKDDTDILLVDPVLRDDPRFLPLDRYAFEVHEAFYKVHRKLTNSSDARKTQDLVALLFAEKWHPEEVGKLISSEFFTDQVLLPKSSRVIPISIPEGSKVQLSYQITSPGAPIKDEISINCNLSLVDVLAYDSNEINLSAYLYKDREITRISIDDQRQEFVMLSKKSSDELPHFFNPQTLKGVRKPECFAKRSKIDSVKYFKLPSPLFLKVSVVINGVESIESIQKVPISWHEKSYAESDGNYYHGTFPEDMAIYKFIRN